MSESAKLRIWRGFDASAGRWETYEVPFEAGQSLLDGLRWIRANRDPTLAIRFSCINANACKECMVELRRNCIRVHGSPAGPQDDSGTPFQQETAA